MRVFAILEFDMDMKSNVFFVIGFTRFYLLKIPD